MSKSNVKTTKNKKVLELAYRVGKQQAKAKKETEKLDDLKKELKAEISDLIPAEWLTIPFTIVNGFNNETVCSLSFQNRSKLDEQTICAELGVKALTVENGYRFINPVACWKFFEVSKVA